MNGLWNNTYFCGHATPTGLRAVVSLSQATKLTWLIFLASLVPLKEESQVITEHMHLPLSCPPFNKCFFLFGFVFRNNKTRVINVTKKKQEEERKCKAITSQTSRIGKQAIACRFEALCVNLLFFYQIIVKLSFHIIFANWIIVIIFLCCSCWSHLLSFSHYFLANAYFTNESHYLGINIHHYYVLIFVKYSLTQEIQFVSKYIWC